MRIFRRRIPDSEIDQELRYHLEQLTALHRASGLSEDEARRAALAEFGHVDPLTEACRDLRPFAGLRAVGAALRQAARGLRRSPGFAATGMVTLALGLGANVALFTLVNAAVLRMIPVRAPAELVWLDGGDEYGHAFNYPFFRLIEDDARFDGLLATFPASMSARMGERAPERVDGALVSGRYFDVLGVRPFLGRLIGRGDDETRLEHPVVVASYDYWVSHLGADRGAVGRAMELNGQAYTLIGVAPPGFDGMERGYPKALFVPMTMKPAVTPGWDGLNKPLVIWLSIAGRVKPGVDHAALGAELNRRLHQFQEPYLQSDQTLVASQRAMIRGRRLRLEPLRDAVLGERARLHLRLLGWIVAALLAMTCANLAGLLVARGWQRRKELATRLALGGSRLRVAADLAMEALLIGLGGGAAGLVVGGGLGPILAARFPLLGEGSTLAAPIDWRVAGFAVALALGTSLVFGLLPAWQATRLDVAAALKDGGSGPRQAWLRQMLLAGQTAAALVLLTAAVLCAVNVRRLFGFDAGFAVERLLIAEIEPTLNGYDGPARLALYRRLEAGLAELAERPATGIRAAAVSNVAPVSAYYWTVMFLRPGHEEDKDRIPRAVAVGPGYFETIGIPVRRGRGVRASDDVGAPRVAWISESLARRAFGGEDPIGRRFTGDLRKAAESTFEIAGVVADVELSDPRRRGRGECVYVPYRQWPFPAQALVIQLRLSGDAEPALAELRVLLRRLDPRLALYGVRTSEEALDRMLSAERLAAWLSGFLAVLAALLVATGLYGLVAREAAARRRELGIRSALGAGTTRILWALLRGVAVAVGGGLAVGVGLAVVLRPAVAGLLGAAESWEGLAAAGAVVSLAVVAAGAAWGAGWPAARTEAAVVLRGE